MRSHRRRAFSVDSADNSLLRGDVEAVFSQYCFVQPIAHDSHRSVCKTRFYRLILALQQLLQGRVFLFAYGEHVCLVLGRAFKSMLHC
jgi:hypothetical protein